MPKRKILVTAALPYANGDIHLGHLVEYLQADFWVRFQKMRGHDCRYVCADDTHGTPVMINARKCGLTPEQLIAEYQAKHTADLSGFEINFDNFYTTHSEENRKLAEEFFGKMKAGGYITEKSLAQNYCPQDKMFLPDRFVKGECPRCHALEQYGDSCEQCGATYTSDELVNPHCSLCSSTPEKKESLHIFFQLEPFREFLAAWVKEHTQKEIANKLEEWLKDRLHDWDISRDAPYFGFPIPGYENKFFYVWLDAPIGYISSTLNLFPEQKEFESYWKSEESELYHFIGKDIVYFHTLFWPAMLKNAGYRLPTRVLVHGFLTVNGEKMSKSRGTFIRARTFLKYIHPRFLRYYYACKLDASANDLDLSMHDFVRRINSDLIGKITNLASRGIQMLSKIGSRLGTLQGEALKLVETAISKSAIIEDHFENRNFSKAMLEIREIADEANRFFDQKAPWKLIGSKPEEAREILTAVINVFRIIAVYLRPVLPSYSDQAADLLAEQPYSWNACREIIRNKKINNYRYLAERITEKDVNSMIEESKKEAAPAAPAMASYEPQAAEITADDFFKIDLRVGKIISAEPVPETDKIMRLTVDLGFETREIFAGIKQAYRAETLIGRLIIVAANLKPKKMKFGTSFGMVCAAGQGGSAIYLLSPDSGAKPGDRIH
ncbi:MAG: methionine--tRNA ligase [Spirochaetes bacterium GWF1_41_5]|nr:MAG: methionine--tRNA ligase [Spirochaetes bacterium GWF1_41_5]HBE04261.1 methionine--tRNA ligase [Spirochaetia bacterium]